MAPMLNIVGKDFERAKKLLEFGKVNYEVPKIEANQKIVSSGFNKDNFIYVPEIKLYVAKERTLQNKNWFEAHKELQENGERMLIIPEFVEFLKYLKSSNNQEYLEIYKDITEVKSLWRAEWLDADFKTKGKDWYINYNHKIDENKSLVPQNSEIFDKNILMKGKTLGISLESWLENPTKQGLPSKKTSSGNLSYWNPKRDNNSVARFDAGGGRAYLRCGGSPSNGYSDLGVCAVREEKQ